jgi:hypothetical protein
LRLLATAACAAAIGSSVVAAQHVSGGLPPSRLELIEGNSRTTFWRSDSAPAHWSAAPLASHVRWQRAADGVETGELLISGTGEAWRTRVVLVRLDVKRLSFSLDTASTHRGSPAWNVSRTPKDAVFAMNAGQFRTILPWGQVILNGREWLPAEHGPLAMTFVVDSAGVTHWVFDGDAMPARVAWAFQSYPVILRGGDVPAAVRAVGAGIDVAHRDARLALSRTAGGSLLVALTRFDGLGKALNTVPLGLTVPEMAAVAGALGAQDAVLLDGGISAQLVAGHGVRRVQLNGWRDVPIALLAFARSAPLEVRRNTPNRAIRGRREQP